MLETLLKHGQPIPINAALASKEYQEQLAVKERYESALKVISSIVGAKSKPIVHCPCSMGKDSLLTLLLCIQAYAQSIEAGLIESSRPLVVNTVDTGVESVPMQMMVRYCAPRLVTFAQQQGVNLQFSLLKPRLVDEFFVRWASAQKIIPNPTKSGDCSVILKVDVAERHLRELSKELAKKGYQHSPIVSMLGSRDEESTRRSSNIDKADLRTNPLTKMHKVKLSKHTTIYQFAPIFNWTDDQVFLFHQLAGTNPMTNSLLGNQHTLFNSFMRNHGLTLAIYGNGKNETCNVIAGQRNNASCGGKSARYGCYICPMTGSIDRSSEALTRHPRWQVLGGDKALAVRDWLFRMSTRMHARAFHAKSVDEVGYNRIALQPNVLRAKHLEKMVWYASMLSVESEKHAREFRQLVEQGREMDHEGMKDINSDPTLTPDVKKQFLEMYKEVATQPLYQCFSEKHALMLSFRWLIDGVATTSYKPISIYQRVVDGERLPLPMTNREYEAKYGRISMKNNLPDAVMIPFHTKQFERTFHPIHSPSILSYWQRQFGTLDLFDKEYNCSIETAPTNSLSLDITSYCRIQENGEFVISYDKPKLDGRVLSDTAIDLIKSDMMQHLEQHYNLLHSTLQHKSIDVIQEKLSKPHKSTLYVPYLAYQSVGLQLKESQAAISTYREKTERVIVRDKHGIKRTTTRLNFYAPRAIPASLVNRLVPVNSLSLNFDLDERFSMSISDKDMWQEELSNASDNLIINDKTFSQWKAVGGWCKALSKHDDELHHRLNSIKQIRNKSWLHRQIRVYGGSTHAHDLLRTAGIEIAPKYLRQLRNTLKRTDLFSEIGVYDYAALNTRQLSKVGSTIDMKQHRQDKIHCVNLIRRERNMMRRLAKQLEQQDHSSIFTNHFHSAHVALSEIDKGLFNVLGGFIDTAEPSRSSRLAAARMYLAINSDDLTNYDRCIKRLLSGIAVECARSIPQVLINTTKAHTEELERLLSTVHQLVLQWRPRLIALQGFSRTIEQDETIDHCALWKTLQSDHNTFAQAQATYYPTWNASRSNKTKLVANKIQQISKVLAELRNLESCLEKSITASTSNAVNSLSTRDKLNFLNVVA